MGKHEIRLRRQRVTGRSADRFRNFGAVVKRHEQAMRMKEFVRVITIFTIILIVIMIVVYFIRFGKTEKPKADKQATAYIIRK